MHEGVNLETRTWKLEQDANARIHDHDLVILVAQRLRLLRAAGILRLTVEGDRSWREVSPARAFPTSDPNRYIGFLDGAGNDIGLLVDPEGMDADSRQILE